MCSKFPLIFEDPFVSTHFRFPPGRVVTTRPYLTKLFPVFTLLMTTLSRFIYLRTRTHTFIIFTLYINILSYLSCQIE